MWWKPSPGSFGEAEARATWELVVELRTLVPSMGLDSLAEKADEVGPWLAGRWPTFGEEIDEILAGLREDSGCPKHLLRLVTLADELEDHLGTGLGWPRENSS